MADSGCPSEVLANEPTGFLRLLSVIVKIATGPTNRTEYTFYRNKISDSLTMHEASVYFIGGQPEIRCLRFVGRAMPMERQAIQTAAREAIARLWDTLGAMKTRPYYYLPWHVTYTSHYAFVCPRGEENDALGMLVQYVRALESAFDGLVDDLVAARMEHLTRPHHRTELLRPAPARSCPSSSASCTPPGQLRSQLPTIEELNQVIVHAPIRDVMPAIVVHASPSRQSA